MQTVVGTWNPKKYLASLYIFWEPGSRFPVILLPCISTVYFIISSLLLIKSQQNLIDNLKDENYLKYEHDLNIQNNLKLRRLWRERRPQKEENPQIKVNLKNEDDP